MPTLDDAFMEAVYAVTKMIPKGQVASYGQVATYVVSPRYARAVGRALKLLPQDRHAEVPWQRVINASGRVSPRGDPHRPVVQERLLIDEGVVFDGTGKTNLAVFGWTGPGEGWTPPYDEPKPERARRRVGRR